MESEDLHAKCYDIIATNFTNLDRKEAEERILKDLHDKFLEFMSKDVHEESEVVEMENMLNTIREEGKTSEFIKMMYQYYKPSISRALMSEFPSPTPSKKPDLTGFMESQRLKIFDFDNFMWEPLKISTSELKKWTGGDSIRSKSNYIEENKLNTISPPYKTDYNSDEVKARNTYYSMGSYEDFYDDDHMRVKVKQAAEYIRSHEDKPKKQESNTIVTNSVASSYTSHYNA